MPLCYAGASPDYLFLLQRLLMDNPDAAVNLARMVAKQPGPPLDLNTMADLFLQRNMVSCVHERSMPSEWLIGCADGRVSVAQHSPASTQRAQLTPRWLAQPSATYLALVPSPFPRFPPFPLFLSSRPFFLSFPFP